MKLELNASGVIAIGAVAAVAGVAWLLWSKRAAIVGAINPASPDNLVNRGVSAIVQAVTGDEHQTVGGLVFDATPAGYRVDRELLLGPAAPPYLSPSEDPYGQQTYYAP